MSNNNLNGIFSENKLSDIIIPLSHPVVGGVGVGFTTSIDGLLLICEAYSIMRKGDLIDVYIYQSDDDSALYPVKSYILSEEEVNDSIHIIVPPVNIKAGWFKIYYTVTHTDSGISDRSNTSALWIKLDKPGGIDPNPQTQNVNENFSPPGIPPSIIYNGVGANEAKKGVPISIEPYINMRVRDKINLSWGGEIISHVVSENDFIKPITITVGENTINKAGDSDNLLVTYEVRDEVNNYSKWSPSKAVSVSASGYYLKAPIVKDSVDYIINIDSLGQRAAIIQVTIDTDSFNINDSVQLVVIGRTASGSPTYFEDYLTISRFPSILEFAIPYSQLLALVQGEFIVSYTLISASDSSKINSRKVTISVSGAQSALLPIPEVAEAVSGTLDGNLSAVTVTVPLFTAMVPGAEIILNWSGVTHNGDNFNRFLSEKITSISSPVSFIIDEAAIKILAGGVVTLYYQYNTSASSILTSEKLQLKVIKRLAAPLIPDISGDLIDPDTIKTALTVRILPWNGMTLNDRIDLKWASAVPEGNFADWLRVSSSILNKPVNFRVPKKYIDLNINNSVRVSYQVTDENGNSLSSEMLSLRIRSWLNEALPAPTVEKVSDGILLLESTTTGVLAKIPAYDEMQAGDTVYLYLEGVASWHDFLTITAGMLNEEITFELPYAVLLLNNNSDISLHYEIDRFDGTKASSVDLIITVMSTAQILPAPKVDENVNGVIIPENLLRFATFRVPPYSNMAAGDMLSAYLNGVESWEDYLPVSGNAVSRDIVFNIPKKYFESSLNNAVNLNYQVNYISGQIASSEKLTLQVRAAGISLPEPVVEHVIEGMLDFTVINVTGVEVRIPAWDSMASGDGVKLFWGTHFSLYTAISSNMLGNPVTFQVPYNEVKVHNGKTINVSYRVDSFDGKENLSKVLTLAIISSALPSPYIKEAQEDIINTGSVKSGATVIIPLSARFQLGDTVEIFWLGATDENSWNKLITITDSDSKAALQFVVPYDVVLSSEGNTVRINYILTRAGESTTSPSKRYSITSELVNSKILVFGARAPSHSYHYSGKSQYLIGYDKSTGKKTILDWRYEDDTETITTEWFRDTQPWLKLTVSSATDETELSPGNIFGNGDDPTNSGKAAMVAILDSGRVVGWGNSAVGGELPLGLSTNDDYKEIYTSGVAVAARRSDNSVVAWGDAEGGGTVPTAIAKLKNIVSLSGTAQAFCALLSTGKVVAWGNRRNGGNVVSPVSSYDNILKVVGSGGAFAALRADKRICAWGNSSYGGLLPTAVINHRNARDIASTLSAFVALNYDNSLLCWGNSEFGGVLPTTLRQMKDFSDIMASNNGAFVVRRTNGLLVAWGADTHGGQLPVSLSVMNSVIEVVSTWSAFAALMSNGSIVAWGDEAAGGVLTREIASLEDVVQISATATAFAALRANGTVVAWGDPLSGGNTQPVSTQLNRCRAIYSSSGAFSAITEDQRVVSWGSTDAGGDNEEVAARLNGLISYSR
ncbi:RCC1 domain-containing protein [Erwinia tasmaniensis]|uniref:RCC1 domain-containing protein n=1 Tax=Erwinia tasmaniensis TaxID=338565 RepID=UPI003A4DFF7F